MKKRYDYLVRNDFRKPATIIENTVVALALVEFGALAVFSGIIGAYLPCAAFAAIDLASAILLWHNNATVIRADKREILIRKLFRTYRYRFSDFKTCFSMGENCVLSFAGNRFSIPAYYAGFSQFLHDLRILSGPFATEEGIEKLKRYLTAHASTPYFPLQLDLNAELPLTGSKIGGIPYWDMTKEYPFDAEGRKMQLLCQLNFSECPYESQLLPKKGILQFFISAHAVDYGMDAMLLMEQKDWRVVFHEDPDERITEDDIWRIVIQPEDIATSPVLSPCALVFSQGISYMDEADHRMSGVLKSAVQEITGEEFDGRPSLYDLIGSSGVNIHAAQIYSLLKAESSCHMLGYPAFIASYDFRSFNMPEEEASYFDTPLLQLNSGDGNKKVMRWGWGNDGIGTFLINSDALKRHDFSRIAYYWDC
ncbi:MAG: DUF1963 domain-containing protein [Treponema sp.]|nr:DUF1963 domain-containing protein [Treponema sp.]